MKDLVKVQRKVGRLREQYKMVWCHYNVLVIPIENSTDALEVSYTAKLLHRNRTDTSGGYIFRRSHVGRSIESVVMQYHKLNDIEQTFRALKKLI
ncbi:MAG: hypothetical protein OXC03_08640 [Flavobacteriaceae bacterium]|nr:hypothetical protein [Flavobacteriaceae bacterium]